MRRVWTETHDSMSQVTSQPIMELLTDTLPLHLHLMPSTFTPTLMTKARNVCAPSLTCLLNILSDDEEANAVTLTRCHSL